jgi:hypothetical protein
MSVVRRLARTGLRRGLLEGSRGWLMIGVAATAVGVARRVLVTRPETIYEGEVKPGRGIEIRVLPPNA